MSPRFDPQLLAIARGIELVLLDVDGVLTDGMLYYGTDGELMKGYHARDGLGLVFVRDVVKLGVISGRAGLSRARLVDLGFHHMIFSQVDKLAGYAQLAHLGIPDRAVAYMGDDVNDLPVMRRVGLSACPADAHPEVLRRARFVAGSPGGRGAVRELCELLLAGKGLPLPGLE